MGLPIRVETRTGDTLAGQAPAPAPRPARHSADDARTARAAAGLGADSATLFADLKRVMLDELHALAASKRGDLLALGLARLRAIAPALRATGLSATVRDPAELARWLTPQAEAAQRGDRRRAAGRRPPICRCWTRARTPALGRAFGAPRDRRNLRTHQRREADARLRQHALAGRGLFQQLWRVNEDSAADRAASRLARRRPAPQGRGGDGGGRR
jgi:ATP-dependent Lhr-like helicase